MFLYSQFLYSLCIYNNAWFEFYALRFLLYKKLIFTTFWTIIWSVRKLNSAWSFTWTRAWSGDGFSGCVSIKHAVVAVIDQRATHKVGAGYRLQQRSGPASAEFHQASERPTSASSVGRQIAKSILTRFFKTLDGRSTLRYAFITSKGRPTKHMRTGYQPYSPKVFPVLRVFVRVCIGLSL